MGSVASSPTTVDDPAVLHSSVDDPAVRVLRFLTRTDTPHEPVRSWGLTCAVALACTLLRSLVRTRTCAPSALVYEPMSMLCVCFTTPQQDLFVEAVRSGSEQQMGTATDCEELQVGARVHAAVHLQAVWWQVNVMLLLGVPRPLCAGAGLHPRRGSHALWPIASRGLLLPRAGAFSRLLHLC